MWCMFKENIRGNLTLRKALVSVLWFVVYWWIYKCNNLILISRHVQSNEELTGKIYSTVGLRIVCFDLKLSTLDSEEAPLSKMSLFCEGVGRRRLAAMNYILRRLLDFCLVPYFLTFCMYNLCRLEASIRRCRQAIVISFHFPPTCVIRILSTISPC